MKFHPYSEVFDLIEGAAFDELVADIKANGLYQKIWLYEGAILDGRNRFLACQRAKVKPQTRIYKGKDPLGFVWSMNEKRRHQTDGQRVLSAAKMATLRDGQKKSGAQICAPSQEEAAQRTGISRRTLQHGRKVVEKGSKALREAVAADEVSVSRAASVVDLPKGEQLAAATRKAERKADPASEPFDNGIPSYAPDEAEEEAALERATAEIDKSTAAVMESDDRFPALMAEIKRLAGLLSIAEASRDHYQNQGGQAVRLLKARDREIESLKKKLAKAEADNEKLIERISIMEEAT